MRPASALVPSWRGAGSLVTGASAGPRGRPSRGRARSRPGGGFPACSACWALGGLQLGQARGVRAGAALPVARGPRAHGDRGRDEAAEPDVDQARDEEEDGAQRQVERQCRQRTGQGLAQRRGRCQQGPRPRGVLAARLERPPAPAPSSARQPGHRRAHGLQRQWSVSRRRPAPAGSAPPAWSRCAW